jgi:hypothetical protein
MKEYRCGFRDAQSHGVEEVRFNIVQPFVLLEVGRFERGDHVGPGLEEGRRVV